MRGSEKVRAGLNRVSNKVKGMTTAADKEATIGGLTIIYYTYKKAGNEEIPILCQKLGKMIRETKENDYTPEMMEIANEISLKINNGPKGAKNKLAGKMQKIVNLKRKPNMNEIDEMIND